MQKMHSMLKTLQTDIRQDVNQREGMELTGPNVAKALGEMCAQIDALARVLTEILERQD
jgi:hypothetical protein